MKHLVQRLAIATGHRVVRESTLKRLEEASTAAESSKLAEPGSDRGIPAAELTGVDLHITDSQFRALLPLLADHKDELLKIHIVRDWLANRRYEQLKKSREFEFAEYDQADVLGNTVVYNKGALDHFLSLDRVRVLFNVVASIGELRNVHERKLLLIGPRSETELYSALAYGFQAENVKALDLLSYSPLVTPGDMHNMPFDADAFDVVFITCVMSYSRNTAKAVSEVLRVLKNGGYVGFIEPMHYDFVPQAHRTDLPTPYSPKGPQPATDQPVWGSVDDVLKMFDGSVDSVAFRSEASPPYDGWGLNISTVFKIKK